MSDPWLAAARWSVNPLPAPCGRIPHVTLVYYLHVDSCDANSLNAGSRSSAVVDLQYKLSYVFKGRCTVTRCTPRDGQHSELNSQRQDVETEGDIEVLR
jgi:hypothetical protein